MSLYFLITKDHVMPKEHQILPGIELEPLEKEVCDPYKDLGDADGVITSSASLALSALVAGYMVGCYNPAIDEVEIFAPPSNVRKMISV